MLFCIGNHLQLFNSISICGITLPLFPPLPRPLTQMLTEVVGTDLMCLVSSHDESHAAIFAFVLHKLDVPYSSLFPLGALRAAVESEQLGPPGYRDSCQTLIEREKSCRHSEKLRLVLLVRFQLHWRQFYHRFEVHVWLGLLLRCYARRVTRAGRKPARLTFSLSAVVSSVDMA